MTDAMPTTADLPLVVLHQDDVGMCHGANTAFVELSRARQHHQRVGDGSVSVVLGDRRQLPPPTTRSTSACT